MGRKAQITIIATVGLLVMGAVGAYALDASKRDQIAKGVTIGGVGVGGMSAAQAREAVRQDVVAPLARPLKVTFGSHRYTLGAGRLKMKVDLNGMVAEAKRVSRDGTLPSRVWRYLSGGQVHHEVAPRLYYSKAAVSGFVAELAKKVDRDPIQASVSPTPDSLNEVPGSDGLKLNDDKLRQRIEAEITTPTRSRLVRATAHRVAPSLSTDQLAQHYPAYITIDRGSYTLRLWEDLKLAHSYSIAVGMVGLETPAGLYHIQNKGVNVAWHVPNSAWAGDLAGKTIPGGSPDNPIKARWMGIFNGAGIHGTDETYSIGHSASHGCIRMLIPDVINLYDQVSVGTPVYIG